MSRDSRSRKWQVTLNNPAEKGYTHDVIKEKIAEFRGVLYWVMSDEIGESGNYHTHLFIAFENAVRFSTIKKRFDGGHFEIAKGTSVENRDYIFKQGDKWQRHKKAETNLGDTHEQAGEMPIERQGARNDLADLYDMIKSGMDNYDILEVNPEYMLTLDKIERARQVVREKEFRETFRTLCITYIYGETNLGKTRTILETHGYSNVYRVTDYDHPFDGYRGQEAICFDEFRSSLKIHEMLEYLQGYPIELPCRYQNKCACFTTVYIVSNIELDAQYPEVQNQSPATWRAFTRRIGTVIHFVNEFEITSGTVVDYRHGFPFSQTKLNPLKNDGDCGAKEKEQ